jgi:hypothetical protein
MEQFCSRRWEAGMSMRRGSFGVRLTSLVVAAWLACGVSAAQATGPTWERSVALIGSGCGTYPSPGHPGLSGVSLTRGANGLTRGIISCPPLGFGGVPALYWLSIDATGRRTVRDLHAPGRSPAAGAWDGQRTTYMADWFDAGTTSDVALWSFDDRTGAPSNGGIAFDADSPEVALIADATGWLLVYSHGGNLFQVGTMIHTLQPVQITRDGLNGDPQLAQIGNRTVLVWQHHSTDHATSSLKIATSVSHGAWQSRVFTANGRNNGNPSIAAQNGHLSVAWERDGRIVYADDTSGVWLAHSFGVRGVGPHVLAGPSPAVTWTTYSSGSSTPNRVYFAQRRFGGWTGGVAVNYSSVAEGITFDRGPSIIYWTPQVLKMVRLAA